METENIDIPINTTGNAVDNLQDIRDALDKVQAETNELAAAEKKLSTEQVKTDKSTKGLSKQMDGLTRSLLGPIAKYATIGGAIAGFVSLEKAAFQAAADHEKVMNTLTQTLKTTGRDAEISAKQLEQMATALMGVTTFDDEKIIEAYTAIAQFADIPTEHIEDIAKAAADMSAALGGDLETNARNIANVLETGLIPRSWGFSAALKDQIKTLIEAGDKAGALNLILTELNVRYGGQAAAELETYSGRVKQLSNNWGDFLEALGSFQVEPGKDVLSYLNSAVIAATQLLTIISKIGLGKAIGELATEAGIFENLPGVEKSQPPPPPSNTTPPPPAPPKSPSNPVTGGAHPYYASGGGGIVPPGYNENYPIFLSSGEKFQVTPRGQSSGGNITININGWNGDAASLYAEMKRQMKVEALL